MCPQPRSNLGLNMRKTKPWISARIYRITRKIHKWAGLTACLWLFVLGVTGVILDHHEWRWVNQHWVPQSWSSDRMNQVIWPGTPMRYIAMSEENPEHIVGGSERGLWSSQNIGETWTKIPFEGLGKTVPQIHQILGNETGTFDNLILATDDGVWTLNSDTGPANRLAMKGKHITSLGYGHQPDELIGVVSKSHIFVLNTFDKSITPIHSEANVTGLNAPEPLYRVMMDIHFGRGLLPGSGSIILNDLGGIALAVLSLSGFLYWLMPKIWKRRKTPPKVRKYWQNWLYRMHGPTIGLVCLIPIFLVSVSALPMNHIFWFIEKTRDVKIERSFLPPVYQAKSLHHEVTGVVAWPGTKNKISIGTRFGILHSEDHGESWVVDDTIPVDRGAAYANFFGTGTYAFAGMSGNNYVINIASDEPQWEKIEGVRRAITGAAIAGETLYVKNSKAIFRGLVGSPETHYEQTPITFHHVAPGTPLFIFVADIHSGAVFPAPWKWVNDLLVMLALLLVLSGPIAWAWTRWR